VFFAAAHQNTLSALRVAYLSRKASLILPVSNNTLRLLNSLKRVGYIESVMLLEKGPQFIKSQNKARLNRTNHTKQAEILLKYINLKPFYAKTKILYHTGTPTTISYNDLLGVCKRNPGVQLILSNSNGMMAHQDALALHRGGHLICSLYN
jgi:ribosomal protein S8